MPGRLRGVRHTRGRVALLLAASPLLQASSPPAQPAGEQVHKTIAVGPALVHRFTWRSFPVGEYEVISR